MAAGATSQAEGASLPREREEVLRRTLRALTDPMLSALQRGLDAHGDQLIEGRLFKSRQAGGCAVGVMLRELDPQLGDSGRVRFWLRDRWRYGSRSYRGPLARNPRLRHLEWIFDDAVADLRALGLSRHGAARAAGHWVRHEAERELQWRALASAPSTSPADQPLFA